MVRNTFKLVSIISALCFSVSAGVVGVGGEDCIGFAKLDGSGKQILKGGVSGGSGGPVIEVSTFADFEKACGTHGPLTIIVNGTIPIPINVVPAGEAVDGSKSSLYGVVFVQSHKTIIGKGTGATFTGGGLAIGTTPWSNTGMPDSVISNVIVRNITFDGTGGKSSETDGINIFNYSHHVWVDHCTFKKQADGSLDIKRGASYCTISWNHYASVNKTSLIGHDDAFTQDKGFLKVTYHHCFFDGTTQRHPRVRFGEVHVLNNYMKNCSEGMGAGTDSKIYAEKNNFTKDACYDKGGAWQDVGNKFASTSLKATGSIGWTPSSYYKYTADAVDQVPTIVPAGAGVGKVTVNVTSVKSPEVKSIIAKSTKNDYAIFNPLGEKIAGSNDLSKSRIASGAYVSKTAGLVVKTSTIK